MVAAHKKSAQLINRLHKEHEALTEQMMELQASRYEKAERIGTELVKVKKEVGHGKFLPWLAENCPELNPRRARQYMRFARKEATDLSSGGTSRDRKSESDSNLPSDETAATKPSNRPQWDGEHASRFEQNLSRVVQELKEPDEIKEVAGELRSYIESLQQCLAQLEEKERSMGVLHA